MIKPFINLNSDLVYVSTMMYHHFNDSDSSSDSMVEGFPTRVRVTLPSYMAFDKDDTQALVTNFSSKGVEKLPKIEARKNINYILSYIFD